MKLRLYQCTICASVENKPRWRVAQIKMYRPFRLPHIHTYICLGISLLVLVCSFKLYYILVENWFNATIYWKGITFIYHVIVSATRSALFFYSVCDVSFKMCCFSHAKISSLIFISRLNFSVKRKSYSIRVVLSRYTQCDMTSDLLLMSLLSLSIDLSATHF